MSDQDKDVQIDTPTDPNEDIENLEVTEDTEDVDLEAQNKELKEKNKMLFARAKKAEGFVLQDGKWVKPAPKEVEKVKETKEVQPTQEFITKNEYQEGILRTSKNYTDEDISVLNVIAKGKGVSLFQAEQDELFKTHLATKAEKERVAKASLGASKGSNQSGKPKGSMTREEHMALFYEKAGR